MKLRIDKERFNGGSGRAEYSTFIVGNSHTKYQLIVNGFNESTVISKFQYVFLICFYNNKTNFEILIFLVVKYLMSGRKTHSRIHQQS